MIQALYQALQISVTLGKYSEIQSIKERRVVGWGMCGAKKLEFNQVNRMENIFFCTDERCAGGRRQPSRAAGPFGANH